MIYYENSKKEIIRLDCWPIMIQNPEDLKEYKWEVTSVSAKRTYKISSIYKKVESKSVELAIFADSEKEFKDTLNNMYDIFEYDVNKNEFGKLYIDDQYLKCIVVGSKLENYEEDMQSTDIKLSVESDYPFWIHEVNYYFNKKSQSEMESKDLDYSFDYAHDYKMLKGTEYFSNESNIESDFIMRIFGPCTNPNITIGENIYNVNVNIMDGEYLEIDSRESNRNQSIILHGKYGEKENCFGKRNKYRSVFEKIPSGECTLTWPESYDIALTLLQERSEPKWT